MLLNLGLKRKRGVSYRLIFMLFIGGFTALNAQKKKKEVPFDMVDEAPLFIACNKRNTEEERKECVRAEIDKVVHGNFNFNLCNELNLKGHQRVVVLFKFGKYRGVKDIQVSAPHPALKAEAERVVKLLPEFTPGRHKRRNVEVIYTLPIMFNVLPEDENKDENKN
ncbi:energy transducer TonB [Winogradskyella immobilis]|uniref:Energy transducer TonB n=1 Tax=Winogradskyella immobilis TaxID=2816852 RepID=A0ABS8EIX4_9FLAO|nr:energy transducer TonB [Winogradskyella immobilis]MCC1483075.1 energy transducer TonB [Winogradskyella immobilis]MCG0015170.1 energy transducer TonB [Winogradskyella immobilis]